ncbi:MAG TPA: recombinase family protein [Jatrophihabitans sp.]
MLCSARVSTTDQQPQLQVDALERAGCYRVFTETASGAAADRPILEQVLDQLRPGDTLVVWKLDRLGRSLRHLVDMITGLADRGVGFRSLQEAIDITTPGGKLVFHVFAALAEFERDLIREQPAAGLAAARARGRHAGRPPVSASRDAHRPGPSPDLGPRTEGGRQPPDHRDHAPAPGCRRKSSAHVPGAGVGLLERQAEVAEELVAGRKRTSEGGSG